MEAGDKKNCETPASMERMIYDDDSLVLFRTKTDGCPRVANTRWSIIGN